MEKNNKSSSGLIVALVGALALLLCFFLPWLEINFLFGRGVLNDFQLIPLFSSLPGIIDMRSNADFDLGAEGSYRVPDALTDSRGNRYEAADEGTVGAGRAPFIRNFCKTPTIRAFHSGRAVPD